MVAIIELKTHNYGLIKSVCIRQPHSHSICRNLHKLKTTKINIHFTIHKLRTQSIHRVLHRWSLMKLSSSHIPNPHFAEAAQIPQSLWPKYCHNRLKCNPRLYTHKHTHAHTTHIHAHTSHHIILLRFANRSSNWICPRNSQKTRISILHLVTIHFGPSSSALCMASHYIYSCTLSFISNLCRMMSFLRRTTRFLASQPCAVRPRRMICAEHRTRELTLLNSDSRATSMLYSNW